MLTDLAAARAAHTDILREKCSLRSTAVRDSFASLAREDFPGPPPWQIRHPEDMSVTVEDDRYMEIGFGVAVVVDRRWRRPARSKA
ncbi:MAG: hypothetical protein V3V67_19940, partial [Myxococcota bacterium]